MLKQDYTWLVCFVNNSKPTNMPALLPIREAAARLGVHPETLRRWDRSGNFRAIRTPSGQRRYRLQDVEHFLNYGATGAVA